MKVDVWFLRAGALWLLVGLVMGIWMGESQNLNYFPVHAHINLVGWVTMALYGLTYRAWPAAKVGSLPVWHFWCTALGAVMLPLGILGQITEAGWGTVVVVGSLLTLLALLMYLWVVFTKIND